MAGDSPCRASFFCAPATPAAAPLAEAFALREWPGAWFFFDSAGLQTTGRHPASAGSLQVARAQGLDLEDHCSKPVSLDLLRDAAWVIGMTRSHAAIFRSRYRGHHHARIGVLGAPGVDLSARTASPPCEEVDDPHGQGDHTYITAGEQILRLVRDWGPVFGASTDGTE